MIHSGLLGREREIERLTRLIADGGALVVRGEAGVGKSALLGRARELADRLSVIGTAGVEAEAELPFSALADVLSPVLHSIDQLPAPQAGAVRAALRLDDDAVADRFAVYAGTRALLSTAAQSRRLLVLVDDAHWIDSASREALLFCARRLEGGALSMLFGVRTGEGAQLEDDGLPQLDLHGLGADGGAELARHARPGIAPEVAEALQRETGGNPLAILEIARSLSDAELDGRAPLPSPLPVGARLQQVFEERLADLPEGTRNALLVAAAAQGRRMDVLLAAMEQLAVGSRALEPAEALGLVTVADGTLTWRHPLVRSAVYHAAPPAQRRAAHSALARVAGDDSLEDHRAWHLAAAAEAPDETIAVELDRMSQRAAERGGTAVVARVLESAARLTPESDARARRLLAAAEAAIATGQSDHALALLDEARRTANDPRLLAQAERLAARADVIRGVPQLAHDRLVRVASEWEADDPGFASELLSEAVVADMAQGLADKYLATARRAFETAGRAGPAAQALPGVLLAMGRIAWGDGDEAVEFLDRWSGIAESRELWLAGPEMVGMVALTWIWIERYSEAERLLTAMTAAARAQGAARALGFPLAVLAELNFRLGRWPAAYEMGLEALAIAEDVGEGAMLANNALYLARFEAALGDTEQATARAHRGLTVCRAHNLQAIIPHGLIALALCALGSGDYPEAIRRLEAIDELETFSHEPGVAVWHAELVEAYIRGGAQAKARERLAIFELDAKRTGRARGHALVHRLRGMLAPDAELEQEFRQSLEWHARVPLPFERARTQLAFGERLRRARRRRDAREQLAAALATFEQLGARVFAQNTRNELAAAGTREPQTTNGGDPWSALTAAERRVVEAIVNGATYNEAAMALFLSPRTVEHHLRQAYRKLGVRSRSELALLLTRAG